MSGIDPDSATPMYRQIAEILRRRIEAGEITWMPSRLSMSQEHGVSLKTAGKALQVLVDEGLIEPVAGKPMRVTGRE